MSIISASTLTSTALQYTADTTGTLVFKTGAAPTTAMTIDASQNVGIGTTSPNGYGTPNFHINGTTPLIHLTTPTTGTTSGDGTQIAVSGVDFQITNLEAGNLVFGTSAAERMRLDASGNLLVGTTTATNGTSTFYRAAGYCITTQVNTTSGPTYHIVLNNPNGAVGSISTNGSTTTYSTVSDYRLKEDILPMVGALDKVSALKPVTYTWKADGSDGQGFIAHELAEVCPDAVTGEKDAVEIIDDVDAEGKVIGTKEVPKYQGIDTSFLVATLTAAIQELKAEFDEYKASHP